MSNYIIFLLIFLQQQSFSYKDIEAEYVTFLSYMPLRDQINYIQAFRNAESK